MVWIYTSPLTKKEEAAYSVLKKRFKKIDIAKHTIKIISLTGYLHKQKFKSPKEIQESAFFDKEKTRPIFDEKTSKTVFKRLKKHGGASRYPFTDYLVRNGIQTIGSYLPEFIQYPVQNIYELLTSPAMTLKENVPLADLALSALHGSTEIGVTTAADIAEAAGGPIGAAIATPFTALAGALASGTALLENDMGQATAHMLNVVPLFGSALGKGVTQMEHQVQNLQKHPDVASYIPLVNRYINPTAGKRFSTQRHKYTKWPKTRRNKSAKI
jgi:hypothetical protein